MPKPLTDDVPAFDVRQLVRAGQLFTQGFATWPSASKTGAMAFVERRQGWDGLRLLVDLGTRPDICLQTTTTACHLGGERLWLLCPECTDRVAVVFWLDGILSCRTCAGVVYRSQRMSEYDRLEHAAKKLSQRLEWSGNVDGPLPDKPKWMRWPTYWRLVLSWLRLKRASLDLILNDMESVYGSEVMDQIVGSRWREGS